MTVKKVRVITDNKKLIPEAATPGSAGYDVTAVSMDYLPEQRAWKYEIGLKIEIPRGYFGDLRPRSSIYGVGPYMLANSCGVIDSDYQGPVSMIFRCVDSEWDTLGSPPYEVGDRIGQLILVPYSSMEFELVKDFTKKTIRGTGGYGSTGKNGKEK